MTNNLVRLIVMEGEHSGCYKHRNINSFFQCPYEDTQKTGENTFIINANMKEIYSYQL